MVRWFSIFATARQHTINLLNALPVKRKGDETPRRAPPVVLLVLAPALLEQQLQCFFLRVTRVRRRLVPSRVPAHPRVSFAGGAPGQKNRSWRSSVIEDDRCDDWVGECFSETLRPYCLRVWSLNALRGATVQKRGRRFSGDEKGNRGLRRDGHCAQAAQTRPHRTRVARSGLRDKSSNCDTRRYGWCTEKTPRTRGMPRSLTQKTAIEASSPSSLACAHHHVIVAAQETGPEL